jgi:hypothetical protein
MNFKNLKSLFIQKLGMNKTIISYDELSDLMIDFEGLGYKWEYDNQSNWKKPLIAIYSDTQELNSKDMIPQLSDIKSRLYKRGIDTKFYGSLTKVILDYSTLDALVAYDIYSYKYPFPIFMIMDCIIIK